MKRSAIWEVVREGQGSDQEDESSVRRGGRGMQLETNSSSQTELRRAVRHKDAVCERAGWWVEIDGVAGWCVC